MFCYLFLHIWYKKSTVLNDTHTCVLCFCGRYLREDTHARLARATRNHADLCDGSGTYDWLCMLLQRLCVSTSMRVECTCLYDYTIPCPQANTRTSNTHTPEWTQKGNSNLLQKWFSSFSCRCHSHQFQITEITLARSSERNVNVVSKYSFVRRVWRCWEDQLEEYLNSTLGLILMHMCWNRTPNYVWHSVRGAALQVAVAVVVSLIVPYNKAQHVAKVNLIRTTEIHTNNQPLTQWQ